MVACYGRQNGAYSTSEHGRFFRQMSGSSADLASDLRKNPTVRSIQEETLNDRRANVRADLLSELNMGLPAGLALDSLRATHFILAALVSKPPALSAVINGHAEYRGAVMHSYVCAPSFCSFQEHRGHPPPMKVEKRRDLPDWQGKSRAGKIAR